MRSRELDDRDHPIRVMTPLSVLRLTLASSMTTADRRELRRIVLLAPEPRWWLYIAVVIGLHAAAIVVLIMSLTQAIRTSGGWTNIQRVQVVLVAMITFSVVRFVTGWARPSRAVTGRLLRAGRCACCCYSLSTLPAEPDHCVICPECSAAWKVTDNASANSAV